MTRRLINDDPRCQRQDNCRASGELCLKCAMAAGVYSAAARKGNADPAKIERIRQSQLAAWADPIRRERRIAAMRAVALAERNARRKRRSA